MKNFLFVILFIIFHVSKITNVNASTEYHSYTEKIIVSSTDTTIVWPQNFSHNNYFLYVRAWTEDTIDGKTVQIQNAIYDFNKTESGFSLKLKNPNSYLSYYAVDTTSFDISNYWSKNEITPADTLRWGRSDVGAIISVNGQTGIVVLNTDDIDDSTSSKKFTNQADIERLINTSGYNTGDQDTTNIPGLLEFITNHSSTAVTPSLWLDDGANVYPSNNKNIRIGNGVSTSDKSIVFQRGAIDDGWRDLRFMFDGEGLRIGYKQSGDWYENFEFDPVGGALKIWSLMLTRGSQIYEFSTDILLSGNSDKAVPTEKAVKTYIDNVSSSITQGTEGQIPVMNSTQDGFDYTNNFKYTVSSGNFYNSGRINGSDFRVHSEYSSRIHYGDGGTFWVDLNGLPYFTNDNTTYSLLSTVDLSDYVDKSTNQTITGSKEFRSPVLIEKTHLSMGNDAYIRMFSRVSDPGGLTSSAGNIWMRYSDKHLMFTNATETFDLTSGSVSDHPILTNLDYANSGHTGFAGTGVSNTFSSSQTFNSSVIMNGDLYGAPIWNGNLQLGYGGNWIGFVQGGAPITPTSIVGKVWMNSADGKLYFTNHSTTYDLTASGGSWETYASGIRPISSSYELYLGGIADQGPYNLQMAGNVYIGGTDIYAPNASIITSSLSASNVYGSYILAHSDFRLNYISSAPVNNSGYGKLYNLISGGLYYKDVNTTTRLDVLGDDGTYLFFRDGGSNRSFKAANFVLSSDKRYKKEIKDVKNLNWIDDVEFKQFRMKDDEEFLRYGVIAQDVERINKNLVRKDTDGFYSVAYIDLLIAKVARQDEIIEELIKRIEKLENEK